MESVFAGLDLYISKNNLVLQLSHGMISSVITVIVMGIIMPETSSLKENPHESI